MNGKAVERDDIPSHAFMNSAYQRRDEFDPMVIAIQHVALLKLGWLAFGLLLTTVTL